MVVCGYAPCIFVFYVFCHFYVQQKNSQKFQNRWANFYPTKITAMFILLLSYTLAITCLCGRKLAKVGKSYIKKCLNLQIWPQLMC